MKFLLLIGSFIVILLGFLPGCSQKENADVATDSVFAKLKDNQARVLIKINGQEFYPSQSIFTGKVVMSEHMLSLMLTDQFEGKTMLNMGGEKWFETKPLKRSVKAENQYEASFKLGKLVDRKNMIGEGYLMADGQIETLEFSKGKIVFKITGKVGKYSDFQQPDKYLPAEGLIVIKKPALSLTNITENDVFSSTTTN